MQRTVVYKLSYNKCVTNISHKLTEIDMCNLVFSGWLVCLKAMDKQTHVREDKAKYQICEEGGGRQEWL